MKTLLKLLSIFIFTFISFGAVNAGVVGLDSVDKIGNISDYSINIDSSGTIEDNIEKAGFSILTTIKYLLSGLLIIFIVYIGIQMTLSMGTDEEQLSKAKRQLWYTLIGLVFINIPGTIYKMFVSNKGQIDGGISSTWTNQTSDNIFINTLLFEQTMNGGIIMFIEVIIFTIAIFVIVLAAVNIILSRGQEEKVTEAKNKIIWSIVGLVFIGFIEVWQRFVYSGNISDGANIFETIENLLLFFAGPVTVLFLTLAGYYYITAGGDEEKVKKAKNIIINTLIATVILLASYAFLKDLITINV